LENGQTTTSDTFDYLMISENDWTNYGPNLIDYLKIPSNYPNGGSGGGGSYYSSQMNEEHDDVYPNPVKRGEVLHLRVPEGAHHVKVIDAIGKVKFVFAPLNNNVEISTAELNGGLYFVQYKKRSVVKQVKFIIE
jgi:hypothetical protein